jgi:hypothetical protein
VPRGFKLRGCGCYTYIIHLLEPHRQARSIRLHLERDSRPDLRNFTSASQPEPASGRSPAKAKAKAIAAQLHHHQTTTKENKMPPTTTMSLLTPLRPRCASCLSKTPQQTRHASLLRRPKRPYTFTQLTTLSDGSTYLSRTTAPTPIYKSTKDTKNNPLWNPSSQKLANVEEDEAGRLRAFRSKFGRGWDAEVVTGGEEVRPFFSFAMGGVVLWEREDGAMPLFGS